MGEGRFSVEIFEPGLRTHQDAVTRYVPSALRLSKSSPARVHLLPANTVQLLPQLLCSVPAQVHTCLEEWWLTRNRNPCVDKDLGIPDPALLVSVEPLGFLGRRILNEALWPDDPDLVHAYQVIAGRINRSSQAVQGFCPCVPKSRQILCNH